MPKKNSTNKDSSRGNARSDSQSQIIEEQVTRKNQKGKSKLSGKEIVQIVIAIIGVIGTIIVAKINNADNDKTVENFPAPTVQSINTPPTTSLTPIEPYKVIAFYVEVNGRQERVEPKGTISVPSNSMLIIEPVPQPLQGMTLEWESCSGAALVKLSENQASYQVKAAGADCVRLIVKADSGTILEDVFFGLTIQ